MTTPPALLPTYAPFPFEMLRGVQDRIYAADGRVFWDYYGGHCVASTGHCHPDVVAALSEQAQSLLFYSTAGQLALREQTAEALIHYAAGSGLTSVFFCNSGAEANENALKVAHKLTGRPKILSFAGGWHGRSLACLAATDDAKITEPYRAWLPPSVRLPFNDSAALDALDWSGIAAVIVEPIQSLAGVRMADPAWLSHLAHTAKAHGSLLILDEIQTGVGRLGSAFAANHFAIEPDLLTSAKGLASGVPIGALLMRAEIAQQLKAGDLGSTFGAGPLACAAALATLKVIIAERLSERALYCEQRIREACGQLGIAVLGRGLLLGLAHSQASELRAHLFSHHILVGASSDPNVLRLMPPLNLSDAALTALFAALALFPASSVS